MHHDHFSISQLIFVSYAPLSLLYKSALTYGEVRIWSKTPSARLRSARSILEHPQTILRALI